MTGLDLFTTGTRDAALSERAAANYGVLKSWVDHGNKLGVVEVLAEIHAERQWEALGYESFRESCRAIMGVVPLLQREARREVVADLTDRGMSTRAIGASLGVSHQTVANDQADAGVKDLTPEKKGLDGKTYTRKPEQSPHVRHNSGENEWYTPPHIIEAARAAMGGIDLDPASSVAAQATVKAAMFCTGEDDGLVQPWAGNVWLNPPYAARLVAAFIDKLQQSYAHPDGLVDQAVVLVNNATETEWGQTLLDMASAVCFPRARIKYLDADGKVQGTPLQGQMIAYLEDGAGGRERFAREFERLGRVMFR